MVRVLAVVSAALAAGAVALGYGVGGITLVALAVVVLGALWAIGVWLARGWASSLGLMAVIAAAGAGLWLHLPAGLMIAGTVGGLLSWDLAGLAARLGAAAATDDVDALARRHLARLGATAGIGLLLTAAAMLVHVRLSFGWAAILALAAVLALGRVAAYAFRVNRGAGR